MGQAFEQAQLDVKQLSGSPSDDELLQLYGLLRQGTVGDADLSGNPGIFDIRAKAKLDAWKRVSDQGLSQDEVEKQYVELVERLKKSYGSDAG
ncbi:hypothetical protein BJI69_10495 [Luteibacter rhizovicinus DSM 16549]|uniref:Uncharacterized protein n=1 Tax=Luteibacter rhizovicinus DSM 16549 TaxID=1440763 RepID=A0A0G9H8F2_9GAMM|nr:acyl-CoA-binding protein [Luteibacter rhizovicinus]APG04282.1 hypothetical protein BJI69_10495 [Luteibacter rhizovicinus DSM 16549]KLD66085.1 hypothetical protein Y883_15175 [Luteibacter rhizovicinus DSM 16549]KLD78785.1 hypothetical protein Y886_08415 [Xanthomonas hyacinthi DSM 19077]